MTTTTIYLSNLNPTSATNGWGVYQKDLSNEGTPLTLNGVTYNKGLGVFANSEIVYNLDKKYSTFRADVGVDDLAGNNGSVVFQVIGDGTLLYHSRGMKGWSPTKSVDLNVSGIKTLKLFVSGGDDTNNDYADWANARLLTSTTFRGGNGNRTFKGGEGYDTVDYSGLSNGIIANLQTGRVFKPIYGALTQPTIMPLGDSITAGYDEVDPTPGAYRIQLRKNFVADGLGVDFVGSQTNGGNELPDKDHQGHPGWKINQITSLVNQGILNTYKPQVILLMIGTNDVLASQDTVSQISAKLSYLIDTIVEKSPNSQLVVSSIAPADPSIRDPLKVAKIAPFNALIPGLVAEKVAQGKKVAFANVGGSLRVEDLLSDGIHPDKQGYNKMGGAWYRALVKKDTLSSIENITGTAFKDILTGNDAANLIVGGKGDDLLTGGAGGDTFAYKKIDEGYDTITDFNPLEDYIRISASGFGGGLRSGVALTTTASQTGVFVQGNSPRSIGLSANFLYNTTNGILSFDIDGTGANSAQELARLTGVPALAAHHLSIVA